ncbi:hypothetical protein, partial [Nocardia sp. NPDC058497]|uniref:hypothetical protein n=1 Tax=Nocardia sp. NPDC058497 TaxID=3346529 RepID=UPI003669F98B
LYHFDSIDTDASLPPDEFDRFDRARIEMGRAADEIGAIHGHSIRKGEALVIPNDHYLHGREAMATDECERLVFRAYANRRATRPEWSPLMIRLDNE